MKFLITLAIGFALGFGVHAYSVADATKKAEYDRYIEWSKKTGKKVGEVTLEEWRKLDLKPN